MTVPWSLLEQTAEAAGRAATLAEASADVLTALVGATGWSGGRLTTVLTTVLATGTGPEPGSPAPNRRRLGLSLPAVGMVPADDARTTLASEVMSTGKAARVADLSTLDPAWSGGELAVPVTVAGEMVAVLEVFVGDLPTGDDTLDLLAHVGQQLAWAVERVRWVEALRLSDERLRAYTDAAPDAIVTSDGHGAIVAFNRAAEAMFGLIADEVMGSPLSRLFGADGDAGAAGADGDGPHHWTGIRSDGSEVPLEVTLSQWRSGEGGFVTAILRDVTESHRAERQREELERELTRRTLHDPLTALPNRALLQDRLESALARSVRDETAVALVCLDLDRFEVVNHSLGLAVGDQLLRSVSERLKAVLRPGDTLARIGGDEFAILFDEVGGRAEASNHADRVLGAMSIPFDVSGREVPITACVGVALAGGVAASAEQVLRDAEVALGKARQRGRGQRELFDDAMRRGPHDRLAVESDLRRAIHQAQLRLFYQPIVDLETGVMSGVEALIRWQHPSRGLLLPAQFIALAEDSGLIVPLGAWVLEEATQQAVTWAEAAVGPPEGLRLCVNVSAHQFRQHGWLADVAALVRSVGLAPGQLVFEITESVLMDDTEATAARLSTLRDLGVKVAIDDFGTGYSSLGYLRDFPVDILKVDRSFIEGVALGPHESALARAVIKLASNLGLSAVAEGVAERDQYEALKRLGCRYGQGFYFSRPQPASSIAEMAARPSLVPPAPT